MSHTYSAAVSSPKKPYHHEFTDYGANPLPAWSHNSGNDDSTKIATQLVVPIELSDSPVTLTCYHCQHHMTTRTKTGPSILTWALCAGLTLLTCCCCLIPFCCQCLYVTEHYCSNCEILLGKYKGWERRK
eukprot:TRINITY_DN2568_c0_g1_i1.p1 TRINITY_DN2568_c0_g1~~TRINITY_DN2568_c0_g1_i1.p1  ORF type:complete len:130 (+),score=32.13 TRINITY_DN2568_c0_g1_i1:306-695(+)